jgi:arginine exporter protein ArgO
MKGVSKALIKSSNLVIRFIWYIGSHFLISLITVPANQYKKKNEKTKQKTNKQNGYRLKIVFFLYIYFFVNVPPFLFRKQHAKTLEDQTLTL